MDFVLSFGSMVRKRIPKPISNKKYPRYRPLSDLSSPPTPRVSGDVFPFLQNQPGPRDAWRLKEDWRAVEGNTLCVEAMWKYGFSEAMIRRCFGGIVFKSTGDNWVDKVDDYPAYLSYAEEIGKELDGMASRGKLLWYNPGPCPKDVSVCPSNAVMGSRLRSVHDYSCDKCGINQVLVSKSVRYGTLDEFVFHLRQGFAMGGMDLSECFSHWLMSPSWRRCLGVRDPRTGVIGLFLFFTVGFGSGSGGE